MSKQALFIDRDGTIIVEPADNLQIDRLEKLEFLPGVITALASMTELDFEFVLATNQDGLGTSSFPEADFWPAHNKMLKTLAGEGIVFCDQLIDRSFEHENVPTRKPRTGMFGLYLQGDYDLSRSFVIGDRITDIQLAKNLGARGILLQSKEKGLVGVKAAGLQDTCVLITNNWHEIAEFLRKEERTATVVRNTGETQITLSVDLDGRGQSAISTGLGFFDHMLWQIVHHAGISLSVEVHGDLHVDEHHTVEDTAIVLGEAILKALGSKRGIDRYGYALPMDESEALVLLDFGGRIDFQWKADFQREKIGDVPTELFSHFFKSFAQAAHCNLHVSAKGENEHHKIEGIFKAFARAWRMAIRRDPFSYDLPSSKGVL
ncbi:MAG: bifunctional histidinol-phosphatase/imidazoleglycerol-phosphate dehydratase HisB [Dysgonamonadaceae bacterium]|jgi:imidazoleglycerol-phosphate dehydratase/histidinol-phosphatase|nr:bifunctional histidinol-phosphatase/imidazoleglycerol-phosphate dehydratase HisB [Dysgonamonadaceae bacterium]